jgi:hypothetical protein
MTSTYPSLQPAGDPLEAQHGGNHDPGGGVKSLRRTFPTPLGKPFF